MKRLIRIMSTVLAIMLLLSLMPTSLMTATAAGYNASAAVAFANSHIAADIAHNSSPNGTAACKNNWQCARFVSNCLSAGGCTAFSPAVVNLRQQLISGGWGTEYLLTENGSSIYDYQNQGKLSAGDPIFFFCKKCRAYVHVVICTGFNSQGKAMASGHNARWNNVTYIADFWDESKHKDDDILVYSFHMNGSNTQAPNTYDQVATGNYWIKNKATGNYMNVSYSKDENATNIDTAEFGGYKAQLYEIAPSTTTGGYMLRPHSSTSRVVNVYADTVVSGKNVCIYDNTGDGSQRWFFEKKNDGYVIRNVQNPNCVLDVENGWNVYVNTYNGSDSQIWILETDCSHTYTNACDTTCNKCGKTRTVSGHSYNAATCTKAKTCSICGATSGSALGHTYTNACDSTCNKCGITRTVSGHSYNAATCTKAKTCSICGATSGSALGHIYTNDCDGNCNRCYENRTAPHTCTPFSVVSAPKNAYAEKGEYATTTIVAKGEYLTYTWYVRDVGDSKWYVSSQKTNTYKVKMSEENNNRRAYCVITDKRHGYSVYTNEVYLRMKATITSQPKTAYAKKGAYATTKVSAVGDGLTYTWYVMDEGDTKWYLSSQKTNTYKMKVSAENNNRKAYCVIRDKYGNEVTTNPVYLRMKAAITSQPKTAYAKKGAYVTTKVTATGEGLTYTWYVRDVGDTKWYVSSQKTNTYKMKVSASNHNRKAYCVIKDKYGNKVTTNTVYLRMKASIIAQPKSVTVRRNAYASTTVKASGAGLRYVWYVKSVGDSKYYKSSVTTATYKVKMTSKVNGRKLICYVYDAYGNKVQSKTIILRMK